MVTELMRRVVHTALRWAPGGLFAGTIAICSVWDEAKDFVGAQVAKAWALIGDPTVGFLAFGTVSIYLSLLWWTSRPLPELSLEPDIPLHKAIRYLAKDSVWASKLPESSDGNWVALAHEELMTKLLRGKLHAFGRYVPSNLAPSNTAMVGIPISFIEKARWNSPFLVTSEPPTHFFQSGESALYLSVMFDHRELRQVWPKRSFLALVRKVSPIERLNYEEVFRRQDAWYVDFKEERL